MSDYIHYFDNKSIAQGDEAFHKGNYEQSYFFYSKALNKLNGYPGDRMAPIMLAGSLKKKIDISLKLLRRKEKEMIGSLKKDSWELSKTSFLKGKQCVKHLYLDKYKRSEQTQPDAKTNKLFEMGHRFEDLFRRSTFPSGINLKKNVTDWSLLNSYTKRLLESNDTVSLFEATIIEEDVMIMVDVINKKSVNEYDFYEVKLYNKLNEVIWEDLSLQYYISKKRFGDKISSFNVVLRKNEMNWEVINVQHELESRIGEIEGLINDFKTILTKRKEPYVKMSSHCLEPYRCPFMEYCQRKSDGNLNLLTSN